jgi:hypothetical protein
VGCDKGVAPMVRNGIHPALSIGNPAGAA